MNAPMMVNVYRNRNTFSSSITFAIDNHLRVVIG